MIFDELSDASCDTVSAAVLSLCSLMTRCHFVSSSVSIAFEQPGGHAAAIDYLVF